MFAEPLVSIDVGGAPAPVAKAIETAPDEEGETVMFTVTLCVESATDDAVIVTFRFDVTTAGAL